jgi:DNA-binding GntR family transcriptional regulator
MFNNGCHAWALAAMRGKMNSVSQPSITDTVFLETRFQILSGAYLPGSNLDREEVASVYGCSPRLLLDVFNALKAEGYVDIPRRGSYSVRAWDSNELVDSFDLWSSIMGVAAARAAERADQQDLVALETIFSSLGNLDFGDPQSVERVLLDYVQFNSDLLRVSRAAPLMSISNSALPNFLFRRSIWSSTISELRSDRKALDSVVRCLLERSATLAKDGLRDLIMRPLPNVLKDLEKQAPAESNAIIARPSLPLKRGTVMFDLGCREPGLNGEIVPFGVTSNV